MRNSLIISIILLFMIVGCGKNKDDGSISLELKDVNTTGVPVGSLLRFTFSFSGANAADSIYVEKIVPDCPGSGFDDIFRVPDYPGTVEKGTIDVTFVNGFSDDYVDLRSPTCGEDDTATFRFVLKDKKGNISDTVTSQSIVIFK